MESSYEDASIDTTTTALTDGSLIDYKIIGDSRSTVTTDGKLDFEAATTSEGVVRLDNHDRPYPGWLAVTTLIVLLFANLLNYIDRCTIAGMKKILIIKSSQGGFSQTIRTLYYFLVDYSTLCVWV